MKKTVNKDEKIYQYFKIGYKTLSNIDDLIDYISTITGILIEQDTVIYSINGPYSIYDKIYTFFQNIKNHKDNWITIPLIIYIDNYMFYLDYKNSLLYCVLYQKHYVHATYDLSMFNTRTKEK